MARGQTAADHVQEQVTQLLRTMFGESHLMDVPTGVIVLLGDQPVLIRFDLARITPDE